MKGHHLCAIILVALTIHCGTVFGWSSSSGSRSSSSPSRTSTSSGGSRTSSTGSKTSFGSGYSSQQSSRPLSPSSSLGNRPAISPPSTGVRPSSPSSSLAGRPAISPPSTGGKPSLPVSSLVGRPAISPPSNGGKASSPLVTKPQISPPSGGTIIPPKQTKPIIPVVTKPVTTRPQAYKGTTTTTTRRSTFLRNRRCNREKYTLFNCKAPTDMYYYDRRRNGCYQYSGCGSHSNENSFASQQECSRLCIGN